MRSASFLFASVIALEGVARAAEAIPASVRVDAPDGCATAASFWRALSRRTDRLREARAGESAASFEVTMRVDPASGTASGELQIVRSGTPSSPRSITASSCEELTQGMSLVAALAFDPAARLDAPPAPAAAPAAPPPAPAPEDDRATPQPRPETPLLRFGGGLSFGGSTLTSTAGTPALGAFLDARWERGAGTTVRAGFARSTAVVPNGAVEADVAWNVGRISVCPIRAPLDSQGRFSLLPCAGVDAGVLSATASRGVTRGFERDRAWLAPSLSGAFEVIPVRPFFVEGRISATFPLIRDELAVNPTLQLYTAPAAYLGAEIAGGVRFP